MSLVVPQVLTILANLVTVYFACRAVVALRKAGRTSRRRTPRPECRP